VRRLLALLLGGGLLVVSLANGALGASAAAESTSNTSSVAAGALVFSGSSRRLSWIQTLSTSERAGQAKLMCRLVGRIELPGAPSGARMLFSMDVHGQTCLQASMTTDGTGEVTMSELTLVGGHRTTTGQQGINVSMANFAQTAPYPSRVLVSVTLRDAPEGATITFGSSTGLSWSFAAERELSLRVTGASINRLQGTRTLHLSLTRQGAWAAEAAPVQVNIKSPDGSQNYFVESTIGASRGGGQVNIPSRLRGGEYIVTAQVQGSFNEPFAVATLALPHADPFRVIGIAMCLLVAALIFATRLRRTPTAYRRRRGDAVLVALLVATAAWSSASIVRQDLPTPETAVHEIDKNHKLRATLGVFPPGSNLWIGRALTQSDALSAGGRECLFSYQLTRVEGRRYYVAVIPAASHRGTHGSCDKANVRIVAEASTEAAFVEHVS
jgi:hypothetical protein